MRSVLRWSAQLSTGPLDHHSGDAEEGITIGIIGLSRLLRNVAQVC